MKYAMNGAYILRTSMEQEEREALFCYECHMIYLNVLPSIIQILLESTSLFYLIIHASEG